MSDPKITNKAWSLTPSYTLTSKLYNSENTVAKIAKYTALPLALLAIAETLKGIAQLPFKLVGNLFGLYNYSFFKAPISSKKAIEDTKTNVNSKPSVWKKRLYVAGALAGAGAIAATADWYFGWPMSSGASTLGSSAYSNTIGRFLNPKNGGCVGVCNPTIEDFELNGTSPLPQPFAK